MTLFQTLVGAAACLALAGCTQLQMTTASQKLDGDPQAVPPVLGAFEDDAPVETLEDWTTRRAPLIKSALARELYGPMPEGLTARVVERRVVDDAYAGGAGVLEEVTIALADGPDAPAFNMALALPNSALEGRPAPIIISQNFCGNQGAMASMDLSAPLPSAHSEGCAGNAFMGATARLIFGAHIMGGPMEDILGRGYGMAAVFPSELIPDDSEAAPAALAKFAGLVTPGTEPEGALAVWAKAFSWSIDVLGDDPRIDPKRTAIWGHSRHGKSALLAAAHDTRIGATISHQSGTGGATLTRSLNGESVKQITDNYPHWFSPTYAEYADREADIPVEQHQLIALIAPRFVLIGNGWRDVWSDPNGAFRAMRGADPVWELFGREGLDQTGMKDASTSGELFFHIRTGGHGVRKVDWRDFLDFLDRAFADVEIADASD
ncbi:MAG: alpha/beta hydrolase [Pseudomonadota bacterium]